MIEKEEVSKKLKFHLKDYFLTNEEFFIYENQEFGFLETQPQPVETLFKYYESKNYISHSDSNKTVFEKIYQFIKNYNIGYKFNQLKNPKSGDKILDYGCGAGDFLVYAKNKKLRVFGVEPNPAALEITRKKLGFDSATDLKIAELDEQFDFITLWHVLEHIPDLENFIPQLKSKLKESGILYIAVPNFESFDAKFYKKYWAAYDVPRHLWHFSPESFEKYFNSFGMKIEKRQALWFDSYYVSMLSEQYKKTPLGILRALIIASISNTMAVFTGNYSSVIYQITKT